VTKHYPFRGHQLESEKSKIELKVKTGFAFMPFTAISVGRQGEVSAWTGFFAAPGLERGIPQGMMFSVSQPDLQVHSVSNERQEDILALARANGRVLVDDLATRMDVTPQTIRKDLNELCERGFLSRVHGGAIVTSGVSNLAYDARRFVALTEKQAIGMATAKRIPNRASIFINIGTTTEEVAKALINHDDLLVITNNLNVATLLYPNPRIEVIIAGGPVRRLDGAVVGEAVVQFIQQFKVDFAIIGVSAIDPDGALLDFDYREVRVSRAIIENARQVILVSDRLKFERKAPVRLGHLADIDLFVTDALPDAKMAEICRLNRVDVLEVSAPAPDAEV
jgi:DeoR family transcriptional regulator, glycerol-3-phosphate regulon repressor